MRAHGQKILQEEVSVVWQITSEFWPTTTHIKRIKEAESMMSSVSVEEWAVKMLSRQDPIPYITEYEKITGQELDLGLKLAGVRLCLRRRSAQVI